MVKIKSKTQLNDMIDTDLASRKNEITYLIGLVNEKRSNRMVSVLAKSLIVLAYSHWEGFVKLTSARYLSYVNFLSIPKSDMNSRMNAVGLAWLGDIRGLSKCDLAHEINEILCQDGYKLTFPVEPLVSTESNLNSEVLRKIITDIGSVSTEFENDTAFLDKKLLKYRNRFAHGEALYADVDEALNIGRCVIALLNKYRDLVENMIATEQYRRIPVSQLS